jgi:DNA-directed RNA polymerase subunit K/omega
MTKPISVLNAFEVVAIAMLRAQQLMRGCVARVPGTHKATTMAQLEIAAGKVGRVIDRDDSPRT